MKCSLDISNFLKEISRLSHSIIFLYFFTLISEEAKIEIDTCIPLFIAALFTTSRTWKQPEFPLTEKWIKMFWYTYTMEYYSSIKRNTFESVPMSWMNLEPITQSEVSQKENDKYRILVHI